MRNGSLNYTFWIALLSSALLWIGMESTAFSDVPYPKLSYGSEIEGGKVACLLSDGGLANLLVAKKDNSDAITWGGEGTAIGKDAQSDNNGAENTIAIVNKLGKSSQYAARLCSEYEIDSAGNTPCKANNVCYDDWFLPSRYQLDCIQQHQNQIGGFADDFYWSSTEFAGYPAYSAWDKYFGTGEHPEAGENDLERVRCARYFNPS